MGTDDEQWADDMVRVARKMETLGMADPPPTREAPVDPRASMRTGLTASRIHSTRTKILCPIAACGGRGIVVYFRRRRLSMARRFHCEKCLHTWTENTEAKA